MKKLLIIFCLLLLAATTYANKVDDLKTDSDVINLIQPLYEAFNYKGAPKLVIPSAQELIKRSGCDSVAATWHIKNWEKVDLNNDHKTDLLAIINWYYINRNYIAIDKGNNTFQLIQIGGSKLESCHMAAVIKYQGQPMIALHHAPVTRLNIPARYLDKTPAGTDTLIYKYGDFVEYNRKPSFYKIDSITFSSLWGWYGSQNTPSKDPYRDRVIEIDHSGNTTLTNNKDWVYYILAKGEQKPRDPSTTKGVFNATIRKADLEEIYNLIDYISIKKLNEHYTMHVTDLESNYIRVKFSDGSIKYIADYGGQGTWGLRNLFSKYYALIKNQDWK
jgi:hypothetical protein